MTTSKLLTLVFCTAAALAVFLLPVEMPLAASRALAITVWMVLLWIFAPIDYSVTGLAGCVLYWVSGAVDFEAAFNGFSRDTPWFLFSAMILRSVVVDTGLAKRMAYPILSLARGSYSRILLATIIAGFVLALVIPSAIARVVILASMCLGIGEAFAVPSSRSNISRGLFVILTCTATVFDTMTVAGLLPVVVIIIATAWLAVLWIYPPENSQMVPPLSEIAGPGPMSRPERRASFLMAVTAGLWMTESIHHIPASMIGIGAGLAACLPKVGILSPEDFRRVDPLPVIFAGAILSLAFVANQTKAIDALNAMFFPEGQPVLQSVIVSSAVLYWTGFLYNFFLPEPASIGASMAPIMQFARFHSLPSLAVGLVWTLAAGAKIFLYQSPVLIVGYSYGQFEAKDLLKTGLVLAVVESFAVMFLFPLLWPWIGIS